MTRVARGPRVPEKAVQMQIVHLLRSIGAKVYRLGTTRRKGDHPGTMQDKGIGDVYAILPAPRLRPGVGCGLWIEAKAAGGRLRPEQVEFRDLCIGARIPHVVGGVDQVMAWLVAGGWLKSENVPHYRQPAATAETAGDR